MIDLSEYKATFEICRIAGIANSAPHSWVNKNNMITIGWLKFVKLEDVPQARKEDWHKATCLAGLMPMGLFLEKMNVSNNYANERRLKNLSFPESIKIFTKWFVRVPPEIVDLWSKKKVVHILPNGVNAEMLTYYDEIFYIGKLRYGVYQ